VSSGTRSVYERREIGADAGRGVLRRRGAISQNRGAESCEGATAGSARVPHAREVVAQRLRVCTAVVYKLCEKGALPALRIGGALRFEPDAVRRLIERTRV